MEGISKRFGDVQALKSVSLRVEKGTIHALIGENGAGKTTLMNILYGKFPATSGSFSVDGKPTTFRNSAEAIRGGIGMVSQHYSIIPQLTCLENLILGAEPGFALNLPSIRARAEELAQRMGFRFDWAAEASTLSPAAAQKLEILKLLWRESQILILDEPTAMLSPQDSDALYESLKKLSGEGKTVIVVTHRLPEVLDHCKHATVLRGGEPAGDIEVKDADTAILARMIVGHDVPPPSSRPPMDAEAKPLLEIRDLAVKDYRGFETLAAANFSVRRGEVLGIAGVDGNGQRELFLALAGQVPPTRGTVVLDGEDVTRASTKARLAAGIRLIPEDRHAQAVVEEWSLIENAALGGQTRPPFAKGNQIDGDGRTATAETIAKRFSTRHGGLKLPMSSLSGGNQQRFVNGRAVVLSPRIILAFQPARGLDIDATRLFYEALYEECAKGAAALVVSFDLDELLVYADRIVVFNHGKCYEPAANLARDRQEIGRLMVGTE